MYDWPEQYDSIHGPGSAKAAKQQDLQSQSQSQSQHSQMEVDP